MSIMSMNAATLFAVLGHSRKPERLCKTVTRNSFQIIRPSVGSVLAHPFGSGVAGVKVEEENVGLLRREAIGFGLLAGLFGACPVKVLAGETGVCELVVTPSGLGYCDKVVGYGPEASKGQLIKAHYVGKLENGKIFDSSYNRGQPLAFRVGVGEVIKGWDQGILGAEGMPPMLAGGKRTLKLPPELGYGTRGAGCKGGTCVIPPNSFLLFDVEFIGKV